MSSLLFRALDNARYVKLRREQASRITADTDSRFGETPRYWLCRFGVPVRAELAFDRADNAYAAANQLRQGRVKTIGAVDATARADGDEVVVEVRRRAA